MGGGGGGDASHITCFICDKLGHYATDCPDKMLKLQETVEKDEKKDEDTHEGDALMMNEVVYLNEKNVNPKVFDTDTDARDVWYLGNGASNHKSGNRMFFSELDDTITGKVRFGDDSRVDIMGKGSIRFIIKAYILTIVSVVFLIRVCIGIHQLPGVIIIIVFFFGYYFFVCFQSTNNIFKACSIEIQNLFK